MSDKIKRKFGKFVEFLGLVTVLILTLISIPILFILGFLGELLREEENTDV